MRTFILGLGLGVFVLNVKADKGVGSRCFGPSGFNLKVGLVNMDPQVNENVCSFFKNPRTTHAMF